MYYTLRNCIVVPVPYFTQIGRPTWISSDNVESDGDGGSINGGALGLGCSALAAPGTELTAFDEGAG